MAFNATFNNISVISWRSVLWRNPEYPEKITDLLVSSIIDTCITPILISNVCVFPQWLVVYRRVRVSVMVFNATFNNISVISWRLYYIRVFVLTKPNRSYDGQRSRLESSMVDCGFELRWGQTKDYNIDICCLSANLAALRTKIGWFGIGIMCPDGAIFLVQSGHYLIKCNLLSP